MLLSWLQSHALRDIITVSAESKNTRHDRACSDRVTHIASRHSVWVCVSSDPGLCLCSPPDISHHLVHKSSRSSAGILASLEERAAPDRQLESGRPQREFLSSSLLCVPVLFLMKVLISQHTLTFTL